MIYSYAYRSMPTASGKQFRADIRAILEYAQWSNVSHGITGALLASESGFVQILEGNQLAVDSLINNLRNDLRHVSMQSLMTEFRSDRRFPDWAMAHIAANKIMADLDLDELSFAGVDRVQPLIERMAELAER